ncbi:MAG: OmpA family protein [Spirochaetales bacterium]|nr:OmpA family protein [Spirochaetales bacterium]
MGKNNCNSGEFSLAKNNGTDNDGNFVKDGVYQLTVSAWDYKGNSGELPPFTIIVDNTPPEADVSLPYTIFSPNDDGNLDDLLIFQETSSEDLWEGIIRDENGTAIKTYSWEGIAPNFTWHGKKADEKEAPEGVYSYNLSAKDLAGNLFFYKSPNLAIDRRVASISVFPLASSFSPNGDGIKDEASFRLEVDIPLQILNSRLEIINESGSIVKDIVLEKTVFPQEVKFDGRGNSGYLLTDSNYFGRFIVVFSNGNKAEMISEPVLLDRKSPVAVLSPSLRVFSPDGDGRKDTITINQTTSIEGTWRGEIRSAGGETVRVFTWDERAITFDWDGLDATGKLLPDGEFYYTASATDTAGNSASYNTRNFIIDTVATPVSVVSRSISFSPNGDGVNDFMEFDLQPQIADGIIGWNYKILDSNSNEVVVFEGNEFIPSSLTWQGEDTNGRVVEGKFQGKLEVEYEKGNLNSSELVNPFTLDLTAPVITSSVFPLPFSPDGDGENDSLVIKVDINDQYNVRRWNAIILDPMGNVFLSLPSSRFRNGEYTWNGKSTSGELVQSASDYSLVITAVDSVGNTSTQTTNIPVDILVLREGANLRIIISSIYFKPYTANFIDVEPELYEKNMETLEKLAIILGKYPDYRIRLEGHAVRLYWDKPDRWLTEENEVLRPLSENRAEAIRDALVRRGMSSERLTTQGIGGYRPVVPHSDLLNRWKNRRVEFILIK